MKYFLHVARKDARYARVWIALTWLLACLPVAQVLHFHGEPLESLKWTGLFQGLAVALLVLSAVRIVQLDPANDSAAFLATRPLSLPTVLSLKLAVVFFVLILPITVLHVVQIACRGIPLTATDYILLVVETMVTLCAVTSVALLPALIRRNLGDYLCALVVFGLMVFPLLFVPWDAPVRPVLGWESYQLGFSRQVLVIFLCLGGALAVMAVYARSRSRRRAISLFVVASIVIVLVRAVWPLDFIQRFANADGSAPASEWPNLAQVSTQFGKPPGWSGGDGVSFMRSGYNGVDYQTIEAYAKFQGLPIPWFPVQRSFHSMLTLSNGKVIPGRGTIPPSVNYSRLLLQRNIQPGYDIDPDLSTQIQLAQYRADEVNGATRNAEVRGEAEVEFRRTIVLHEFPLQEGAVFTRERQRFIVRKVSYSEESLQVEMTREQVSLRLRGETPGRYGSVFFLLINQSRHEFVNASGSAMGGGFSAGNYSYTLERRDYEPASRQSHVRFTDDWIRGARLLLIGSESGGTLNIPFAFQSVDLVQ